MIFLLDLRYKLIWWEWGKRHNLTFSTLCLLIFIFVVTCLIEEGLLVWRWWTHIFYSSIKIKWIKIKVYHMIELYFWEYHCCCICPRTIAQSTRNQGRSDRLSLSSHSGHRILCGRSILEDIWMWTIWGGQEHSAPKAYADAAKKWSRRQADKIPTFWKHSSMNFLHEFICIWWCKMTLGIFWMRPYWIVPRCRLVLSLMLS